MSIAPQDIGRLAVILVLLVIWQAYRGERAHLHWALAYLAITLSGVATDIPGPPWVARTLYGAASVLAVLTMWSGARQFAHRPASARKLIGRAAWLGLLGCTLNLVSERSMVVGLACMLALATSYAAYAVWQKQRDYRWSAAWTLITAWVLLAIQSRMVVQPTLDSILGVAYALLAIAIVHVTVQQFQNGLMRVTHTDPLTGLANRAAFIDQIQTLLSATARDPIYVAVLCLDIAKFRRVNEAIGHLNGNRALREISGRIRHAAQRVYVIARDEADRFMLVLSGTSEAAVIRRSEEVAAELLAAMATPIRVGDSDLNLRMRIGADVAWGPDADAERLLQHAALASGRQSEASSAGAQFYSDQMNQTALRKMAIERGLREAVRHQGLHLLYQPIVDFESGQLLMVEALLRWHAPTLGHIEPSEMIPVAEESGLIDEVGAWVIREAAGQAARWARQGHLIAVSVNVSAQQLSRPAFAALLLNILSEAGVAAHRFEVELTESVFLGEDPVVMDNLRVMQDAGVRLSVDDFGTGFSSLAYLTRLPLTTIKIDKSFVHELQRDERSRRLTETICAIGTSLDLQLIAEGVETLEQAVILHRFGVTRMQGFLFATALPAELIEFKEPTLRVG